MLERPGDGVLKGAFTVLEGGRAVIGAVPAVPEGGVPRPLAERGPQHVDLPRGAQYLAGPPAARVLQPQQTDRAVDLVRVYEDLAPDRYDHPQLLVGLDDVDQESPGVDVAFPGVQDSHPVPLFEVFRRDVTCAFGVE